MNNIKDSKKGQQMISALMILATLVLSSSSIATRELNVPKVNYQNGNCRSYDGQGSDACLLICCSTVGMFPNEAVIEGGEHFGAAKLLAKFTKDGSFSPTYADDLQRIAELSGPTSKSVHNRSRNTNLKVATEESVAIDSTIKDSECLAAVKRAGLFSSDRSLLVPTLNGNAPMWRFICTLMKNGVTITEFSTSKKRTESFASVVSFKMLIPYQFPVIYVGEEIDLDGQKIIFMSKRVVETSNKEQVLSLNDWRLVVTSVIAYDKIQ